ncbi:MAG: hypothetical protein EA390_15025 [Balneolaceae bacterium]|nr:MAG: hypothetical protein EA390_15025 [Balneolaceae bacterium]
MAETRKNAGNAVSEGVPMGQVYSSTYHPPLATSRFNHSDAPNPVTSKKSYSKKGKKKSHAKLRGF